MSSGIGNDKAPSTHMSTLRPGAWYTRLNNLSPYTLVLLAQVFILLPHINNLPGWLTTYGFFVIVSQLPSVKMRAPWARKHYAKKVWRSVQLMGFVAGLAGIYLTYRTAFGLDVGVSFLLLCLISKLLELNARRDGYVVLNLSLFVLAGAFLMDQGVSTTLMVLVGVLAVLYAMIAHNETVTMQYSGYAERVNNKPTAQAKRQYQTKTFLHVKDKGLHQTTSPFNTGRLRSLSLVAFLAIPLMVVLFIFFPRMPPLWNINLSGVGAKTGMSDSMSPGDIASLSQSTELAFRVLFNGKIPPKNQLYFRGLVFSDFDGVTWKPSTAANTFAKVALDSPVYWLQQVKKLSKQPPIVYDVMMQPTNQQWLFALDMPFPQTKDVLLTRNYVLESREPVAAQLSYKTLWFADVAKDLDLYAPQSQRLLRGSLQLPSEGNSQARAFAKQLFNNMERDPARYSDAVLAFFRTQGFGYTLEPAPLFDNRIDEFLFSTKQGFCEHYASAYTFLMRAAGVPARVVVGYQGGEVGRDGSSWEVRQMDAHAWSEIWLNGRGWVRIDPTAAIAPDRINSGMSAMAESQGAALFGDGAAAIIKHQQFQLLKRMRKWADYAEFVWQRDVVGFDEDKQKKSLLEWFNIKNQYKQVLIMFGLVGLGVAGFIGVMFWRRRKIWHPIDAPFIKLSKILEKRADTKNLARKHDEGIIGWLERLKKTRFCSGNDIDQVVRMYRRARFSADSRALNQAQTLQDINSSLNELRQRIKNQ